MEWEGEAPSAWEGLGDEARAAVLARAKEALIVPQEDLAVSRSDGKIRVKFESETVEFPFRPVKGHWLGLDNSGRDVGVRILYATRSALIVGISLTIKSCNRDSPRGSAGLLRRQDRYVRAEIDRDLGSHALSFYHDLSQLGLWKEFRSSRCCLLWFQLDRDFLLHESRVSALEETAFCRGGPGYGNRTMEDHVQAHSSECAGACGYLFPLLVVGAFRLLGIELGFGLPQEHKLGNLLDRSRVQPYA